MKNYSLFGLMIITGIILLHPAKIFGQIPATCPTVYYTDNLCDSNCRCSQTQYNVFDNSATSGLLETGFTSIDNTSVTDLCTYYDSRYGSPGIVCDPALSFDEGGFNKWIC